jgi:hypothetical protein
MRALRRLALTAALSAAWLGTGSANAERFSFAVFGDIPYTGAERALMPDMFEAMAVRPLAFAVHVGDFKAGNEPCSDALYRDRRSLFDAAPWPLTFVPGDNDWTDCRRRSNGAYDPLERLQVLRRIFHAGSLSLGREPMAVERQGAGPTHGAYPENMRWRRGRIEFLTLNVPGSHNNFGDGPKPSNELLKRSRANAEWIAAAFAQARAQASAAVVMLMQGNPDFEAAAAGTARPGYRELLSQLVAETLAFPGQVLLVHGDTHIHRIDQPLRNPANGAKIANFTRVEVWGSPFMGWTEVSVDDAAREPFRFEARLYSPQSGN